MPLEARTITIKIAIIVILTKMIVLFQILRFIMFVPPQIVYNCKNLIIRL